jgi:copper(I)-binding protein
MTAGCHAAIWRHSFKEFSPMLRRAAALVLLIAAPAIAAAPPVKEGWDRSAATASNAWVRAAAVPGRPAAGYLTVKGGGQPDTLVAVTAPGLRVEMHSMTMDGGVMKMAKLESVPVPAGATVGFVPGGNHLMIFGMTGAPKTLPLTLNFRSGATLTTTADVRAAADSAPANPHAMHGQP